jgi:hypothetical protein
MLPQGSRGAAGVLATVTESATSSRVCPLGRSGLLACLCNDLRDYDVFVRAAIIGSTRPVKRQ